LEILRSKYAGACYGVERALKMVQEAPNELESTEFSAVGGFAEPPVEIGESGKSTGSTVESVRVSLKPIRTLGPLIHNPQVVAELKNRGVEAVDSLAEATSGTLVIRSHGVPPEIILAAEEKGLTVLDATCPHVTKAQQAANKLNAEGYRVLVVGERGHPEVEGISAHAGSDCLVVQDPSDLPDFQAGERIGVVVQTTQTQTTLDSIVKALKNRGVRANIYNTICSATRKRQEAARELAEQVDVMLVVGGRNSGNTTRLSELCTAACPNTHHLETPDELQLDWFKGAERIGITGGASTPEAQIVATEERLKELLGGAS
jgi:4-hydroxy-3-methylbut-2-enyl diphosphate reductase